MLELYLLRHADAGDSATWAGPDEARPLSAKGHRQAERLGAFLARLGFAPDAVITSPLIRARETADIVAAALHVPVVEDDRLAFGAGLGDVQAIVADHGGASRLVLVGHDPDFSGLVADLTGADAPMKKGALARLDVIAGVVPGGAVLRWLVPPEILKA
jgi:phosphohistidine phosphatase